MTALSATAPIADQDTANMARGGEDFGDRRDSRSRSTRGEAWTAPLLFGALIGSMVAGRYETAWLCVAVAIAAATGAGAGRPARRWVAGIATSAGLAIALNLYLTPGHPLEGPRLLGRAPTAEGLEAGGLFALRILGAMTALLGLRAAWPGERAADEIAAMLRPLERVRVPIREARVMIGLALRFAPLLAAEVKRITAIQDLRAGSPPRGAAQWWVRRRAVMVPAMVAALERAEQVALALEARHYRVRPVPPRPRGHRGWIAVGFGVAGAALLWRK